MAIYLIKFKHFNIVFCKFQVTYLSDIWKMNSCRFFFFRKSQHEPHNEHYSKQML